jgi:hypothetical protein
LLVTSLVLGAACSPASPQAAGDAGVSVDDAGDAAGIALAAPRPVAPVGVSFLTSRRPTFRWALGGGADGARVEVCRDRACTAIVASFDAPGDQGSPPDELPAGVVFWRLRGMHGGAAGASTSAAWEAVVPSRSSPRSTAWGAMLDANGDGFGDVVVGDSDTFAATQHVYVHHGGPQGPAATP